MEPRERAIWRHELRGGYGYEEDVPVVIVRLTPKRVRVLAQTRSGAIVERSVSPDRLREPTVEDFRAHDAIYARLLPAVTPFALPHYQCRCAIVDEQGHLLPYSDGGHITWTPCAEEETTA